MIKYLLLDSLFEASRMIVGAINAIFLLRAGMHLEFISQIKMIQAAIVLLFEVPTGVVADIMGRKMSLVISSFLGAIGYFIMSSGHSSFVFIIGAAFIALCFCFWSGAYEAYSISKLGIEKNDEKIASFFHKNQAYNTTAMLISGGIGGIISQTNIRVPYFTGGVVLLILALLTLFIYENDDEAKKKKEDKKVFDKIKDSLGNEIKNTLILGMKDKTLRTFIGTYIFLEFLTVPLIYFWQPYFEQIVGIGKSGITNGAIFTAYHFLILVSSIVFSKISQRKFFRRPLFLIFLYVIASLGLLALGHTDSIYLAATIFCITITLFFTGRTSINALLNSYLTNEKRASFLSSISLYSRIGMIIALGLTSLLIKMNPGSENQASSEMIGSMFTGTALIALTTLPIILFFTYKKGRNEKH